MYQLLWPKQWEHLLWVLWRWRFHICLTAVLLFCSLGKHIDLTVIHRLLPEEEYSRELQLCLHSDTRLCNTLQAGYFSLEATCKLCCKVYLSVTQVPQNINAWVRKGFVRKICNELLKALKLFILVPLKSSKTEATNSMKDS